MERLPSVTATGAPARTVVSSARKTRRSLTIKGVNGRPHIQAGGNNAQGKGIWVIAGNNTIIENIEMSGAAVPDNNGSAIRQEGANLTVSGCYIHDNQEGVLTGANLNSSILIEYSEFARMVMGMDIRITCISEM